MPAAPRTTDTPLAILLPTSAPLTPQQVAVITNKIQTLTTEVSDLDWQLLKLSPVRRLPLELLGSSCLSRGNLQECGKSEHVDRLGVSVQTLEGCLVAETATLK